MHKKSGYQPDPGDKPLHAGYQPKECGESSTIKIPTKPPKGYKSNTDRSVYTTGKPGRILVQNMYMFVAGRLEEMLDTPVNFRILSDLDLTLALCDLDYIIKQSNAYVDRINEDVERRKKERSE